MIIHSVVIVGTTAIGILGLGIKTVQDLGQRKSARKRTFVEKLDCKPQPVKRSSLNKSRIERISSAIMVIRAKSIEFIQEIIAPFVNDTRAKQLQDITDSDGSFGIHVQKQSTKNLWIASAGLLLVLGGSYYYAPLYIPGLLLIGYIYSLCLKGAYRAGIKERRFNMDVGAVITGTAAFIGGFFVVTAIAYWINQVVGWLTNKTEYRSRQGMMNLLGEQPRFVWVVESVGDPESMTEVEVPFDQVQIGDQVSVTAGQMIPVDGTIRKGIASIDQHKLTGEGQPAEKTVGDEVFASTVVLGRLHGIM